MIDKKQPIIVKKINHGEHGHHGGSWKVAFADFAVAMMAFFLLLWLLGGTSDEEKAALSEYFRNPSAVEGAALTPAPSSAPGPGGASTSLIQFNTVSQMKEQDKEKDEDFRQPVESEEAQQRKQEALEERERLEDLMQALQKAIEQSQALEPFKDQLLIDITPEGLRIQIVDKANRPMFDSGKADLKYYTVDILFELAKFIREMPNRVSITGHTDGAPFVGRDDYSNWELSSDRANAARRALVDGSMAQAQIGRVVGLADSTLFDKTNPYNPINRRISIIVMNKAAEAAIARGEGVDDKQLDASGDARRGAFREMPMDVLAPGSFDIDLDR